MSVKLEWDILDADAEWPDGPTPALPQPQPRRSRKRWLVLAGFVIAIILSGAGYLAWTYHAELNRVAGPVRQVARLEAQAIANNDRSTFMALQDPDDPAWREVQEQHFGRLERMGVPEIGWQASGQPPQYGAVSLEPGGARIDVTYHFSVTRPLPGGPTTVTLRVPQFYKSTPAGWMHAMPAPTFWGGRQFRQGKYVDVAYFQRDADIIEPSISQLNDVTERACNLLDTACPHVTIAFDSLLSLSISVNLS